MLRFLRITRLAVIDAVDVEFEPGFNVLTGETGAGKSILVEAVGLLLGGRASGDLVRTGEDVATVEAIFQTPTDEVIIRREATAPASRPAKTKRWRLPARCWRMPLESNGCARRAMRRCMTAIKPSCRCSAASGAGSRTWRRSIRRSKPSWWPATPSSLNSKTWP